MAAYTVARFTVGLRAVTGTVKKLNPASPAANVLRCRSTSSVRENGDIESMLEGETYTPARKSTMSKYMKVYLQRAEEHEAFMKQQIAEYDVGRRHLANMMGEDPATFTQKDINEAIRYLFPSGLFDQKARPMMLHPEDVYPSRKEAQFDHTGRPHHYLFYTAMPKYYEVLYDIAEQLKVLSTKETDMIYKTKQPVENNKFDPSGSNWLSREEMCKLLHENISEDKYNYLITSFERLADHPLSADVTQFFEKYRKRLQVLTTKDDIIPTQIDEDGRPYVFVDACQKKTAIAQVTVRGEGIGKITINGQNINYFQTQFHREQIVFPLLMSGMLGKVDIEAQVSGGGPTSQASAIRYGIALGLRSFVSLEITEKMRIAGLLTRDFRRRERKKFGQEGARRKFTWKKR